MKILNSEGISIESNQISLRESIGQRTIRPYWQSSAAHLDDEGGLPLCGGAFPARQHVHHEVLVQGAGQRVEARGHGAGGHAESARD